MFVNKALPEKTVPHKREFGFCHEKKFRLESLQYEIKKTNSKDTFSLIGSFGVQRVAPKQYDAQTDVVVV